MAAIRDFRVERYQITSETQGEPRSLRFTFEFDDNEHFDACTLVKEFEYRPSENGPGDLVSKPVPIKWKNKKDLSKGMLTMAVELEAAEEAMKMKNGGKEIDLVEREGLWQYEKLREAIEKSATADDDEPTFLNWFGFRGAVERRAEKVEEKKENGDVEAEEEDDEDLEDGLLDVEIFPAGEDVAIALAEELFPEAIDIFSECVRACAVRTLLTTVQCLHKTRTTTMRWISKDSKIRTWRLAMKLLSLWRPRRSTPRTRSVPASVSGRSNSLRRPFTAIVYHLRIPSCRSSSTQPTKAIMSALSR